MNVVWLASYPRSGNTWLRTLLYSYIYGKASTSAEIGDAIPDIHMLVARNRSLNREAPHTILCKTHYLFGDAHPHAAETAGFIYLVRHPRDVLLSNLNYLRASGAEICAEDFATEFTRNMGLRAWSELGMGSWSENLASWLGIAGKYPYLIIKYEDMLADTRGCLKKAVGFLNQPIDERKLRDAVEHSSFKSMRRMEEAERGTDTDGSVFGGSNRRTGSEHYFVNASRTGQSLLGIGEEVDRKFQERFGGLLELTGYEAALGPTE